MFDEIVKVTMASEHPVTSFSSTIHNPEQYNGFVFWNQSTECLRNIRNIVQTFVKQVLLLLLRVEEEEASVQVFDFSLIRRQKYSLCWFIQCSRVPSIKSLCANVDLRSHCNQNRINWTGLSKCAGRVSADKGSSSQYAMRNTLWERQFWTALSHNRTSTLSKRGCQHVACLPLDWPQLHTRLLCWQCVSHNVQEHCWTRLEQLGAISSLPSFKTIDFYLISDELMFSECHYCERVNVTLRFASNSLSLFHFILAD